MRIITFFIVICFSVTALQSQSVVLTIDQLSENSTTSWKILDSTKQNVIVSSDTVTAPFYIQGDQRCFFQLDVDSISDMDTALYQISIGYEPIMYFGTGLSKGLHMYPFFTGYKTPELRIVGGSDASIEDFPWQVYFASGIYMCGGSIISSKWILTAAHCTKDSVNNPIPASEMYVIVGATNPYSLSQGKRYYVKSYTAHVDYDPNLLVNDLALLELYEEIDFENAEAIQLITKQDSINGATDPGVMSTVSGWGITDPYHITFPDQLQQVEVPIVSNSTAAFVWGRLKPSILMAGYRNSSKDACSGDSGGPLVVEADGTKKLAGVVSFGSSTCDTYGGYTRVTSHLNWIRDISKIAASLSIPEGDNTICSADTSTLYTTDSLDANYYEWQITPDSAGSLQFADFKCNVTWEADYFGEAVLKVRASIDSAITPWSSYTIDRVIDTRIISQSADTSICEGENIALLAGAEGVNLKYNWYFNNQFQLSTYNGAYYITDIDTLESGFYYCQAEGACKSDFSDSIHINVIPKTNITTIFEDKEFQIGSAAEIEVESLGDNLSYNWFKDNVQIENENQSTLLIDYVTASDIGLYYVNANGTCESDTSNIFYVYVGSTTGDEPEARIWPTISGNSIYIAIKHDNSYKVQVIDMQGKKVFERENLFYHSELDLSSLAQGVYLIVIESDGVKQSQRIVLY